jgi:hypothetical protein
MNPNHELRSLIGIPIMSAINTLSAMGYSCKDISKETVRPTLKIAGVLHCTKQSSEANTDSVFIVLPFSEEGIILDVIELKPDDPG